MLAFGPQAPERDRDLFGCQRFQRLHQVIKVQSKVCAAMRVLWLILCATASGLNTGETPCQQCCAPGGDCSKAFKGTPGKCCGTLNGQAFCCPGVSYRGSASGNAKSLIPQLMDSK